ncbi:MAG: SDR family NAD(P)-dependent oxidoreductase, partial [Gammaproteobacteria bacterium]|nr:SDR family NAD(P)-dependent oxidoreductase [Gammaproteobacteria bacterium]
MKVLIIGGTGTLGQALVDELLKHDVESIRIYARNEYKMWQMRQKYGEPVDKLRYFIGDIRDKQRLNMAFED